MEQIEKFCDRLMKDFCTGAHGTGQETQAISFRIILSILGSEQEGFKKAYFFEGAGKARFAGVIQDAYDMDVTCVNHEGNSITRSIDPTARVTMTESDFVDIISTGHNFQAAYLDGRVKITGETGGVLLWGLLCGISFAS